MYIERERNLVNFALHFLNIINIYQGFNTTIIFIYLFSIALIIINVHLYTRDKSLFSSLRLFIDIKRGNSTRHGRTDDHEISSDCQTNSRNEERWDRSKTGRTMVLLMFDEEKSPIRHYYKRHFINGKRVISCQINSLAFVKVRNYDGFCVYTSSERITWKFNWKVSRGIEYTSNTWREGYAQYSLIYEDNERENQ